MKKIIALAFVCAFGLALVSCGKKTEEASTETDSSAVVVETPVADSAAMPTDSAAVTTDSAAVAE